MIWENRLKYRHRAGHTIETAPGHVTLQAVTQIASGGLWVTATVQVDLALTSLDLLRSALWTVIGQLAEECRASPDGGHAGPLLTCC